MNDPQYSRHGQTRPGSASTLPPKAEYQVGSVRSSYRATKGANPPNTNMMYDYAYSLYDEEFEPISGLHTDDIALAAIGCSKDLRTAMDGIIDSLDKRIAEGEL